MNDVFKKNQIRALKNMVKRPMPTDPYTPEKAQQVLKDKFNINYNPHKNEAIKSNPSTR